MTNERENPCPPRKGPGTAACLLAAVMLLFSLVMAGFVLARSSLDFGLEDTARSLETSRGRERKQQKEYDEVVAQIPLTRAELEEVQPRAAAAAEQVRQLKETRKKLRREKEELEQADSSGAETAGENGQGGAGE